jgi:RNA polymerase primary sigma factor
MAGDREAQGRLTEAMLPKVIDIARLYAGQGVLMEDLIGGGNEALALGVTLLGPLEKAEEVEGFLGRRIMDAMEDMIAANMDERAGDKAVEDKVNRVAEKAAELAGELLRKVTPQELAAEGELTLEEILEAVRFSGNKIEDIDTEQGSGEGV